MDPLVVGRMSLFELLSTSAGLRRTDSNQKQKVVARDVTNDEWDAAMDVIGELAQFDPSISL